MLITLGNRLSIFLGQISPFIRMYCIPLCVLICVGICNTVYSEIHFKSFDTDHYKVWTDVNISEAKRFARHMDRVYEEYVKRFENVEIRAKKNLERMNLYLLGQKENYEQYLNDHGVNASNTAGMFVSNSRIDGLFTYIQAQPVRRVLSILQHEGFHQFANTHIGRNLPKWINEGTAEYFEDGVYVDNNAYFSIPNGRRLLKIQSMLKTRQNIPFAQMLSMNSRQWLQINAEDADRGYELYAQAWSMVYYLITVDDKTRNAFIAYLKLLGQDQDSSKAFAQAFGHDADQFDVLASRFETGWKQYIQNQPMPEITLAQEKLKFLANGLLWMRKENRPFPSNLNELKHYLQKVGYYYNVNFNDQKFTREARDDSQFYYTTPSGQNKAFILAPATRNLPPLISAPGLSPTPVLVWYYAGNELIFEITYK